MRDRPGRPAPHARHPSPEDEASTRPAEEARGAVSEPAGPVAVPGATRSGDDTRRRGWFWHWNSIVTQYAPLIGLKGVGLLNSYTVWTDRREESPHRGYAFPSQQSEADFYGEDRAELITINKILVALDLIEIRKEMVLRVDEQGRRWRVPHNFYRVKDHGDGAGLTRDDVLRVAALAERDQAVYRFVRRVFSARFAPIDRDNVWARMLPELRQTELWQRLSERAAREEGRASARTRAGHAARKGVGVPGARDIPTSLASVNDTTADNTNTGAETSVAAISTGFDPDVGGANRGFAAESTTSVEPVNVAPGSAVAPANTTYDQSRLTTTTTRRRPESRNDVAPVERVDSAPEASQGAVTELASSVTARVGMGPGRAIAPSDGPGEAAALRGFEEANGRGATPAERRILGELAGRFDAVARGAGAGSGWATVAAAIEEAVEAGSAYVAPRRIREILRRWERDGWPAAHAEAPVPAAGPARSGVQAPPAQMARADLPEVALPHGIGSARTWAFAVGLLGTAVEPMLLAELVRGTGIAGYRDGEVTLLVPEQRQAERIMGEYRELFTRKLSEAMRRPVRLAVLLPTPPAAAEPDRATPLLQPPERGAAPAPVFMVEECGLPSTQVWAAVLDELVASGGVSRVDAAAWFASTRLLGRGAGGGLIVGTAHALAQRRIAARFAAPLRAAVAAVLGAERPVEIVAGQDYSASTPALPETSATEVA